MKLEQAATAAELAQAIEAVEQERVAVVCSPPWGAGDPEAIAKAKALRQQANDLAEQLEAIRHAAIGPPPYREPDRKPSVSAGCFEPTAEYEKAREEAREAAAVAADLHRRLSTTKGEEKDDVTRALTAANQRAQAAKQEAESIYRAGVERAAHDECIRWARHTLLLESMAKEAKRHWDELARTSRQTHLIPDRVHNEVVLREYGGLSGRN